VDFFVNNWYLVLIALASAAGLFWPLMSGGVLGAVTIAEAVNLMNREKALVIDVRTPQEFATGTIQGAKNVVTSDLAAKLPVLSKSKELPIVLICATGARSQSAARVAKGLGFTRAQSMAGGMSAWRAANMPVQKV
jgi:rhodanese-related sulfurtransferase